MADNSPDKSGEKKDRIRELTVRLTKMEDMFKESENEKVVLQRKLEISYSERERLENLIQQLGAELEKLKKTGDISSASNDLDQIKSIIGKAEESGSKDNAINDKISNEMQKQLDNARNEIKSLQKICEALRTEKKELKQTIEQLEEETSNKGEIEKELKDTKKEMDTVVLRLSETEQTASLVSGAYEQLQREKEAMAGAFHEHEKLEKRVAELEASLKETADERNKLSEELAQAKGLVEVAEEKLEVSFKAREQAVEELNALKESMENQAPDMLPQPVKDKIAEMENALAAAGSARNIAAAEIEELKKDNAKYGAEIQKLRDQMGALNDSLTAKNSECETLNSENKELKASKKDIERDNRKLNGELEESKAATAEYEKKNAALEEELAKVRGELNDAFALAIKHEELQSALNQIDVLNEKLEVSYRSRDELARELEKKKEQSSPTAFSEEVKGIIDKAAKDIETVKAERDSALESTVALKEQLNETTEQLAVFQNEIAELEKKLKAREKRKKSGASSKDKHLAEMTEKAESLEKELEIVRAKKEELEFKLMDVIEKKAVMKADDSYEISEYIEQIETLKEEREELVYSLSESRAEIAVLNESLKNKAVMAGGADTMTAVEESLACGSDMETMAAELNDRDLAIIDMSREINELKNEQQRLRRILRAQKRAYAELESRFVSSYRKGTITMQAPPDNPEEAEPGETKELDIPLPVGVNIKPVTELGPRPFAYLFDPEAREEIGALRDVVEMVHGFYTGVKATRHVVFQRFRGEPLRSHSHNVGRLAIAAAIECGYSPLVAQLLGLCGFIHDVGFSIISGTDEKEMLRQIPEASTVVLRHAKLSEEVLANVQEATPIMRRIVSEHHERIDGSGYPKRLQGEEVHVLSQILGIADTLELLISGRSEWPKTIEQALNELENAAKSGEYNPMLLRNFRIPLLGGKK